MPGCEYDDDSDEFEGDRESDNSGAEGAHEIGVGNGLVDDASVAASRGLLVRCLSSELSLLIGDPGTEPVPVKRKTAKAGCGTDASSVGLTVCALPSEFKGQDWGVGIADMITR